MWIGCKSISFSGTTTGATMAIADPMAGTLFAAGKAVVRGEGHTRCGSTSCGRTL